MSFKGGEPPKKNSSQWVRNEKIINQNSTLKAARDRAEGFTRSSTITSAGFGDNYDKIDFSKRDDKPRKFRIKINGKYQDEE